ncbi:hypothetical protein WDU94_009812 [Cyamophila willieti]
MVSPGNGNDSIQWSDGSSIEDLGLEGWYLQTCTEMMMPFCSTEEEMFEPYPWDYDGFKENCGRRFGVSPSPKIAEKLYGGLRIEAASNIIFSNGLLDPWSGAGVLHNVSSTVVSIIIPEGAHHLDLRAANKEDPHSVIEARNYYETTFRKWIKEFELNNQRRKEEFEKYKSQSIDDTNDIWRYIQEMRQPKRKIQASEKKYVHSVKYPADLGMFYPRKIMRGH